MKVLALCFLAFVFGARGVQQRAQDDRTITKVVKMLEGIAGRLKEDGESERVLYAKFKCYCDKNEEEKSKSIAESTSMIGLLENKIDEMKGSNGKAGSEVAQLKALMTENEQTRSEAASVRASQEEAFAAESASLTAAIEQLGKAIQVLSDIGADQTKASGSQFMATSAEKKVSMLKLQASMDQALSASKLLEPAQRTKVVAALQAPLAGNYAAHAGDIVGILKTMKETFSSNLAVAEKADQAGKASHEEFLQTKQSEYDTLKAAYEEKQSGLSATDADLVLKKNQLEETRKLLADHEAFLASLQSMCSTKAKEYDQRNLFRANEQAAIAQAIAILNSDAAFATFGKVRATSSGAVGFMQLSAATRGAGEERVAAQRLLLKAAQGRGSDRLVRAAGLLRGDNPFDVVLGEMAKIVKLIEEEGAADQKELTWCNMERDQSNMYHGEKTSQITALSSAITDLVNTIDDPESGLKKQIEETELGLISNAASQKTQTQERKEANQLYQETVADTSEAERLLTRAIAVLKNYYSTLAQQRQVEFTQTHVEPVPPETWSAYTGHSESNSAIGMLEFILQETQKEQAAAHAYEKAALQDYEDSMAELKQQESDLQSALASLQGDLATAQEDLGNRRAEKVQTEREKATIETYLEKIKPGCDFITENFKVRESNRAAELQAIERAEELIKESPKYKR
mmetsp:Transcript_61747/g.133787  ORF Transcript_61747/g.133787 Transcript_61747/m.133787 type:complete len:689 (-) Transcript_61747:184-2250(-)|eukprot:CAMPEP_0170595940 /NCGR_PEP_ID=MMETSP0224-20130122/14837_1 /TAXON_ID=285029 /ORGANISM="Togula jolla, Strain CCCM 725" /LENGTH=688 /DNA_ID=CAMNT_0010920169 /DNA_START=43 /DNA_END=2109 /DNA_ORIENTATION=+